MLPEKRQCKKVIAWSDAFGMDQYVSWNLFTDKFTLDTIWEKFKEFCKPQSNEFRVRFDFLTSFQWGNKSVDEWYNAVQTQVALAKYPEKQPRYFTKRSFGFSWICLQDNTWQQHRPGQVSCKQGQTACKENGELKCDCQAHQASDKWPPGNSDQFDAMLTHRSPSKEAQEEKNLCKA